MKKLIIIISLIVILTVGIILSIPYFYSSQYNSKGISHFLVITIDKNQSKEHIGELENKKVYIENLNIKETNFRSVEAKNVSVKEVLNKKLTSIKEWRKYAWSKKKKGNTEILIFDNYEIAITKKEVIIRPITK